MRIAKKLINGEVMEYEFDFSDFSDKTGYIAAVGWSDKATYHHKQHWDIDWNRAQFSNQIIPTTTLTKQNITILKSEPQERKNMAAWIRNKRNQYRRERIWAEQHYKEQQERERRDQERFRASD